MTVSSPKKKKKNVSKGSIHEKESIKLLVCTANLGNAKPDAASWDAWIPKDGRIIQPSIPVRMTPPLKRRGVGRTKSEEGNTIMAKQGEESAYSSPKKSNPRQRKQQSSQEASAFSLQRKNGIRPSIQRNLSDPDLRTKNRREEQEAIQEEEDYHKWLQTQQQQNEDDEYEKFLQQQHQQHQQHSQEADETFEALKDHDTEKVFVGEAVASGRLPSLPVVPPSCSTDDSTSLDSNHFPAFSDADSVASDDLDQSDDSDDKFGGSWVPKSTRKSFSTSSAVLAPSKTAKDVAEQTSPTNNSVNNYNNQNEFFDIIVIGMQEATFELKEKKGKKHKKKKDDNKKPKSWEKSIKKKKKSNSGTSNTFDGMQTIQEGKASKHKTTLSSNSVHSNDNSEEGLETDDDDSIDSLSSSDDEEDNFVLLHDDGTVSVVDSHARLIKNSNNEYVLEDEDKYTRKTTSKGLQKLLAKGTSIAGKKIVKVGFKAGKFGFQASKKVGKAGFDTALKTAAAIDTYGGGGKDHTKRPVPSIVRLSPTNFDDDDVGGWTDTDTIHYRLEAVQIPGYKRTCSYQLGEMRLMIYVRMTGGDSVVKSVELESIKYQATGIGGLLANKGGIIAEVLINRSTRLSFLTAHLEAHEGEQHFQARLTSFQDILIGAGHKYYDATQSSHYSFVMGDLNFRTKLSNVNPDRQIQMTHDMAAKKKWHLLNEYDELREALSTKKCLVGYETPYCNFNPTFKVARHDGYTYNPKRSPSYTDRILFKSSDQLDCLEPFIYEPVESFVTSDHKPIRSAFEVTLNATLRWKPADPLKGAEETKSPKKTTKRTSKTEKKAMRELLHFFISEIKCIIAPNEYDKIKKVEKADLPCPVLLFVSNPNAAIHKNDGASKKKIWSKLGLGPGKEKATKRPSDAPTASSSKYPATSVQKGTLRPDWGDESVHFSVSTHKPNGEAISLGSAMLHFCLRDSKASTVIGSYVMNLAHLIAVTRKPQAASGSMVDTAALLRCSSTDNVDRTPPGRTGNFQNKSKRRGSSDGFQFIDTPSSALLRASASGNAKNEHVQQASLTLNPTQLNNNSNYVLRNHVAAAQTFESSLAAMGGGPRKHPTNMHQLQRGPSKSLLTAMVNDGNASSRNQADERLKSMNLMSLRVEKEPLISGGLEVGIISCCIDVWWTKEE